MTGRLRFSLLLASSVAFGRLFEKCFEQHFMFNALTRSVLIKSFWPEWTLIVLPILFLFSLAAYPVYQFFVPPPEKKQIVTEEAYDETVWPPPPGRE